MKIFFKLLLLCCSILMVPAQAAVNDASFYFVIHADPHEADDEGWNNITAIMSYFKAHKESSGVDHHLTVMWTPQWGNYVKNHANHSQKIQVLSRWINAGHEMAFHSHTRNHAFPDGFSQYAAWQAQGTNEACSELLNKGQVSSCDLDEGMQLVQDMLDEAYALLGNNSGYPIRFARIGPEGDGGLASINPDTGQMAKPSGINDNNCEGSGLNSDKEQPYACIHSEWRGTINSGIPFTTRSYTIFGDGLEEQQQDYQRLLATGSGCISGWGEAQQRIYWLPHGSYWFESGGNRIHESIAIKAMQNAGANDKIGIVIHAKTFMNSTDYVNSLLNLFNAAEANNMPSKTLSEVWQDDNADGGDALHGCKSERLQ